MSSTQILEELVRSVTNKLLTKAERIGYLRYPELRKALYDKHPNCFMKLKKMGQDTEPYFICLCNRVGLIDPDVIDISYKVISKIMNDPGGMYDVNDLTQVLDKLDKLKRKYSKEIPKPPFQAAQKAKVTKMFNKIQNHLQTVRK